METIGNSIDKAKYYKMLFVTYFDGGYQIEPTVPNLDTFKLGICKLEYKEGALTVYLRRPGLLIGKDGQTLNPLRKYLGIKIHIHEVDLYM